MSRPVDANGMPSELGPLDMLLHRGEANPRTRSGIMALEILDTTPDWERFRACFDNASRKVLRLRQRVVVPTLPTAPPRWVVDPDFNLDFHVRRVRVPEPGTLRQVLDLAEVSLQSPLDISRPLWTATLVEGLEGGKAATLLHLSHAVTDGVGAATMFAEIYDLEREPPSRPAPPMPVPQDLTPNDLMREGLNQLPGAIVGGLLGAVSGGLSVVGRMVRNPGTAVFDAVDFARSGRRVMGRARRAVPVAAAPEPVLAQRGHRDEAVRSAVGRTRGGRLDQRRLPGGAVRRPSALPRGARRSGQQPADGRAGEPARGGGPGRRQPVRGGQPGGADRCRRRGAAHPEDPQADDLSTGGGGHRPDRLRRAGAQPAARRGARGDERIGDRLRRPGQQRAGLFR